MVTETAVEQVVQTLARGEGVSANARAYGLDRKMVRVGCRHNALALCCSGGLGTHVRDFARRSRRHRCQYLWRKW